MSNPNASDRQRVSKAIETAIILIIDQVAAIALNMYSVDLQ